MSPILVEPTNLSFNVANLDKSFSSPAEELKEFAIFIKELKCLLEKMEECNIKIAATGELLGLFKQSVPDKIYEDQKDSRYEMSKKYMFIKLGKQIKKVHKFGKIWLVLYIIINCLMFVYLVKILPCFPQV